MAANTQKCDLEEDRANDTSIPAPIKMESKPTYDEASALLQKGASKLMPQSSKFRFDFGLVGWFDTLQENFGGSLLVMLFFVQHLMKGFAAQMSIKATPYMYKRYHLPAPTVQIYSGIAQLPWSLKPIIGLISDVLPIRGYNKSPYMLLTSLVGGVSFLIMGILPQARLGIQPLVVCMFLKSLQLSTCDLLSEAKYAEKMHMAPAHGPALLTYVWFGMQLFGLIATIASGPMLATWGPQSLFIAGAVPALGIMIPVVGGCMDEKKSTPEDTAKARERLWAQSEACFLCILMLLGTVALTITGLVNKDPLVNCIASIVVAGIMLTAFSVVLSPVIAMFNAFSLIQTSLHLSTGGATFYFYTDTPDAYPDGPHFSAFFYNTVLGTVGTVCSLIGIMFYQRYMKGWKYRDLLLMTNVVMSALSLLDVLMFARVNKRIGIPDHIFCLGLSVFEEIIHQWQWMPQVVILSYLCPKGMEATMYALLAGCHNLGNSIGSSAGALLIHRLGVTPTGKVGDAVHFEKLWVAALVATILPFFAIFILIRLVPDARQNERLVSDTAYDATTGSLWSKWFRGGRSRVSLPEHVN